MSAKALSAKDMYRLEPEGYPRVRAILDGLSDTHLHVAAILDGTSPGKVYVDDVIHPRTACVAWRGIIYYLAGDPGNRSFNAALGAMLPRDTYFVLFCDPDPWRHALGESLKETYAIQATRRHYTLKQLRVGDWRERVPDGFRMQPVDAEFLDNPTNLESVQDWILDGWHSVGQFLTQGFGHCLVHESGIASRSLVDYISDGCCEIGISTDWNYRRQGYGTLTAAANAAHALARGFETVGWHCWDNNVGSIGVAGNVGFELTHKYGVFINHWVAENITDMNQAEFRAFAQDYERQFEARPPASGYPHIVAAKAWALSGDRAGCYRHLHKAVDLGWLQGPDHLRRIWPEFFWNPDLDEIKEWQDLVKRFDPA